MKPGKHLYSDGDGLYLSVSDSGAKSWIYRYMIQGKISDAGIGPVGPIDRPTVNLAEARDRAAAMRRQVKIERIDPLAARRAQRSAREAAAAKAVTFRDCAGKYIAANRPAWKNTKHAAQWEATLATYAYPMIGDVSVSDIETAHVTRILETIWTEKPETASRVRGRIEAVLDYAATHRWRTGENPARWRGHLENVLPKTARVHKVEHHAALPWNEIGAFMVDLAKQDGVAALALRFAILTAARTGEVIGSQWEEIDLAKTRVWTIPAERMKGAREHRVPLSSAAEAVLQQLADLRAGPYLFAGGKTGKTMSNMAMLALLRRMKRDDLTVHGFRSTFRDWAAETGQPPDIAEAALAHVVGGKVVVAYQRGDLLERRRQLMDAWSTFCGVRPGTPGADIIPLIRQANR